MGYLNSQVRVVRILRISRNISIIIEAGVNYDIRISFTPTCAPIAYIACVLCAIELRVWACMTGPPDPSNQCWYRGYRGISQGRHVRKQHAGEVREYSG